MAPMRRKRGQKGQAVAPNAGPAVEAVQEEPPAAAARPKVDLPAEAPAWYSYYRRQAICTEEEFQTMVESFRASLPMCFRVNCASHMASEVLAQLHDMHGRATAASEHTAASEGAPAAGSAGPSPYSPRPLAWSPRDSSWQWDALSRWDVRFEPRHKALKQNLVWLASAGAITRQEAVSMIPPLCLDVRPEHLVLDLCAAPGSKTTQMLEMLHRGGDRAPSGAVIANEVVGKRADILVGNVNRLCSPNVVVTNMCARFFPSMYDEDGQQIFFDRVLADVPCSCDGTIRKNPCVWQTWDVQMGMGLHARQFTILCRGLDLLRVGGRLVYSTCSLNPLEDEAVVAAALKKYAGSVELAEFPELDGMRGRGGLHTWSVPHPDAAEHAACWQRREEVPQELRERVKATLFPPLPGSAEEAEWAEVRGRCRRFLPQDLNSGGFFVAVLTRVKAADAPPTVTEAAPAEAGAVAEAALAPGENSPTEPAQAEEGGANAGAPPCDERPAPDAPSSLTDQASPVTVPGAERRRGKPLKPLQSMTDFSAVPEDDETLQAASQFFAVDLHRAARGLRVLQRRDGEKTLYVASAGVARVVLARARMPLRVISGGLRVFKRLHEAREDGKPSAWRATQESLPVLLSVGVGRRIDVDLPVMRQLLERRALDLSALLEMAEAGLANLSEVSAAAAAEGTAPELAPLRSGSVVVVLRRSAGGPRRSEASEAHEVAFAGLLTPRGLEVYTCKSDAKLLLKSLDFVGGDAGMWLER